MRAILIDPERRTLTEIQLEDDDYRGDASLPQLHDRSTLERLNRGRF